MDTNTTTSTPTIPTTRTEFGAAAAKVASMLRSTGAADLTGPTPCGDWDLRTLIQHTAGTTTGLAKIGRKQEVGSDPWTAPDVPDSRWNEVLADCIVDVAEAWTADEAWTGTVELGAEMPAHVIGDMAYAEILIHGWDVARAISADLEVPPPVAAALLRTVEETAELGRQLGAYGPKVEVAEDAGDLERALGAAGRDPQWRAPN